MANICPILYIGGDPTPSAADQAIIDFMNALGWPTVYVEDVAATVGDAFNKSMIYISETVLSTAIAGLYTTYPLGIICSEPFNYDDLLMTGGNGATNGGETDLDITVAGATHPVAAGKAAGTYTVYSPAGAMSHAGGAGTVFGAGVQIIANVSSAPTQECIFLYEAGDLLVGGTPAPDKRMGFFLRATGGGVGNLTVDGEELFATAIAWAALPVPQPDCNGICNGPSLLDCAGTCFDPTIETPPNCINCDGTCRPCCDGNTFEDCTKTCVICNNPPTAIYQYTKPKQQGKFIEGKKVNDVGFQKKRIPKPGKFITK